MKTIKYADYKKQETYYKTIPGSYNKEDKTIGVYDRTLVEFDFKYLKNYKPIHVTMINIGCGELRVKITSKKHYENYNNFYEDQKEYFDGFFEIMSVTEEQKKQIIEKVYDRIADTYRRLTSMDNIKKYIEKGSITNYIEIPLDSLEIINKKDNIEEVKEEKPMKIVTMRYFDYKKTKFKKVPDSYNSRKNTIDVYVPEDYELPEMQIVEVDYDDYKKQFKDKYEQIYGSYNNKKHTVKIRVPMDFEYEFPNFNKVTMLFKDYKKSYSKYRTVGSYNDKDGTIKVLLPEGVEYVRNEKDEHYEEIHAFKKGYTDEVTITPKKLNIEDFNVEVPECLKN